MAYKSSELYADDAYLHTTNETTKRLVKDVSSLYKNPLHDMGIYYTHDDENMLRGYAMIIGPKDTPYEDGFYFFKFHFPYDYPQHPPRVFFMTNDGKTRFHPNLYRNGKVCLSILNTWRGEGWTSCQTIRTILMTIISVLDDKPLLNEPGITEKNKDFETYNNIISYMNIKHAIISQTVILNLGDEFNCFVDAQQTYFNENRERILDRIRSIKDNIDYNKKTLITRLYNLNCKIDYDWAEEMIQDL